MEIRLPDSFKAGGGLGGGKEKRWDKERKNPLGPIFLHSPWEHVYVT